MSRFCLVLMRGTDLEACLTLNLPIECLPNFESPFWLNFSDMNYADSFSLASFNTRLNCSSRIDFVSTVYPNIFHIYNLTMQHLISSVEHFIKLFLLCFNIILIHSHTIPNWFSDLSCVSETKFIYQQLLTNEKSLFLFSSLNSINKMFSISMSSAMHDSLLKTIGDIFTTFSIPKILLSSIFNQISRQILISDK